MPKSRVRKKKGKPVKYTPKPTGISKTRMKQLMELIAKQQELMKEAPQTPEIREEGSLHISEDFTKKMNVLPSESINEGPELQNDTDPLLESEIKIEDKNSDDDTEETEGPVSSSNE